MSDDQRNLSALKLKSLHMTCEACPSQWEGETEDGRAIYVRYRWGHLNAGLGSTITEAVHNAFGEDSLIDRQLGGEYDGVLSTRGMADEIGLVLPKRDAGQ